MRRAALLLLPAALAAATMGAGLRPVPARAADPPEPTLLHLAETAEVARAPDLLVATLRAEARGATAAAAQEAVNRAMAAALARARAVAGVDAATGSYWTTRIDENRAWQAAQALTLRGGDGAALLEVVGALQGAGLATQSLAWTLTREAQRGAREEAARIALDALRRRADAIAAQLGLAVAGLREVRVDVPERMPRPMAAAAPMAARAAAAPPVAVAEEIEVQATVGAVVVLRPR